MQETRRNLWRDHFSFESTRRPLLITYGWWNAWCDETFGDDTLISDDPVLREYERWFRMQIFHDSLGDDFVCEPWIPLEAVYNTPTGIYGEAWGVEFERISSGVEHGSWKGKAPIAEWGDVAKLAKPAHSIDEAETERRLDRLGELVGDILTIDVRRGPVLSGFGGDISTAVSALRGLDQLMLDMYESPEELHGLLSFMRDGVLDNQHAAETAGDYSLTTQHNQAVAYARELEPPTANRHGVPRGQLWGFCAAQEYTLISPEFHERFLLDYQMPIMKNFGLIHYGCCEDLTRKIDMLRAIPNLRSIAVTPAANVEECARQIGGDYVMSVRPNPTDMVCSDRNVARIRSIVGEYPRMMDGQSFHIHLKDVENLHHEPNRLSEWVRIVRDVIS